jgi:hypothetical protein
MIAVIVQGVLSAMFKVGFLVICQQVHHACPEPGRSIQGLRAVALKVLQPFRSDVTIHLSAVRFTHNGR